MKIHETIAAFSGAQYSVSYTGDWTDDEIHTVTCPTNAYGDLSFKNTTGKLARVYMLYFCGTLKFYVIVFI